MRRTTIAAALAALVSLAACQRQGQFDKADGTFDRAAYRAHAVQECRRDADKEGTAPGSLRDQVCGCEADAFISGKSDEELRAAVRSGTGPSTDIAEPSEQCMSRILEGQPSGGGPTFTGRPVTGGAPTAGSGAGAGGAPDVAVSARARAALASYVTADDYPAAALRNNEQGRVRFALDVGPDGRVTNCAILESSGSATLDSTTCRIMRSRARFTPAHNAQGDAMADRVLANVLWRLED